MEQVSRCSFRAHWDECCSETITARYVRADNTDKMTDDEVLRLLQVTFAVERPAHFTNHPGCSECAEHDDTLQAHTLESLGYAEVGSAAWNPITMCTPEAFGYWLPALARICLAPEDTHWGWYGDQLFTSDLRRDGPRNERWAYCTPVQRTAIAHFVEHVIDTREGLIEDYDLQHEMLDVLSIWSDAGDSAGDGLTGSGELPSR